MRADARGIDAIHVDGYRRWLLLVAQAMDKVHPTMTAYALTCEPIDSIEQVSLLN